MIGKRDDINIQLEGLVELKKIKQMNLYRTLL